MMAFYYGSPDPQASMLNVLPLGITSGVKLLKDECMSNKCTTGVSDSHCKIKEYLCIAQYKNVKMLGHNLR